MVSELVEAGYLQRFKDGRRNHYRVDLSGGLRHPVTTGVTVGDVLAPMVESRVSVGSAPDTDDVGALRRRAIPSAR